jgi:hypothetical protein
LNWYHRKVLRGPAMSRAALRKNHEDLYHAEKLKGGERPSIQKR